MNRIFKIYQILTVIFLGSLITGFSLSIYELLYTTHDFHFIINGSILLLFFITVYFLIGSKSILRKSANKEMELKLTNSDKFLLIISCLNFIIGLSLTSFPIYIFSNFPVYKMDLQEISRISLLILIGLYGVIKMFYSIKAFQKLTN